MKYLSLCAIAVSAIGCGDEPAKHAPVGDPADEIRVVYQGRLDGEFEPCG